MFFRREEKRFVSTVILLAVIALLASACGRKASQLSGDIQAAANPQPVVEETSQSRDSSNVTITTTVLLTGAAARQEAGPIGSPQDEASLAANGILPWGPVQAVHEVDIDGTVYTVNQLTSPDPFTAEYQLENGNMYSTNMPLEKLIFFDSTVESPEAPTELWQCTTGDYWEVISNRITVDFDNTATEAEIAAFIASESFNVVMSWFEPLELSGGGQTSSIGSKSTSQGLGEGGLSEGGGGTTENLLGGSGNVMAWFELAYDSGKFISMDAAIAYLESQPKIVNAIPIITDFAAQDYPVPNDEIYKANDGVPDDPYGRESRWADAYDLIGPGNNLIPMFPYPDPHPKIHIAVMDDGVKRGLHDTGKLSNIGMVVDDDIIGFEFMGGEPVYRCVKPGMENYTYYGRLMGHGTQIASVINGATDNIFGIPSLAPGAVILPIRLKMWTKFHGIEGVPNDRPQYSSGSPRKAVRGLRFHFKHEQWQFQVRVVNMSLSWPSFVRNIPELDDPFGSTFKTNVSRDLNINDRLYIGSAGNEGGQKRAYPAAHSNVLGVSGLDYDPDFNQFWYQNRSGDSSNYMPDATYPVSGVYTITAGETNLRRYTAITPPLGGYWGSIPTEQWYYKWFGGTSCAAPQVSALAYHLYSRKPYLSPSPQADYLSVSNRIVNTRISYMEPGFTHPLKGPANFHDALTGW